MQPKTKRNNFPGHDHSGTHIFLLNYKKNRNASRVFFHSEPFQEPACIKLIARTYIGLQHVQRYFESFFSDDEGFNFVQTISIINVAYFTC